MFGKTQRQPTERNICTNANIFEFEPNSEMSALRQALALFTITVSYSINCVHFVYFPLSPDNLKLTQRHSSRPLNYWRRHTVRIWWHQNVLLVHSLIRINLLVQIKSRKVGAFVILFCIKKNIQKIMKFSSSNIQIFKNKKVPIRLYCLRIRIIY